MGTNRFASWSLAAAAAALALPACTVVGPAFAPPAAPAPQAWSQWHGGAADLAPDAAASASLATWDPVLDATLRELLALADANNADLQTAALRFAQARTQRRVAQAQAGPQLDANAAVTRQRLSEDGAGTRMVDAIGGAGPAREALRQFLASPYTTYDAGFDASWELDLWGRVRRAIEAADANADQARALLGQVRLSVRAELARDYYDLRSTQAQLRLAWDELAAARDNAALVEGRVAGGLAPDVEAVQQRGIVADLESRIPALQQQEAAAINQITLLAGQPPGALNAALASPAGETVWAPPALALGIPSELAARRPDIRAALAQLHAATANIGVAVGDLYPRIALTGSFGFESLAAGSFGDWASRQWRLGPSLSIPVFDGGRRRGVVELRRLEQQEAAVRFQQTVLRAWHEVDGAVAAYNAERARGTPLRTRLASARETMQLAQERYRNGLTTFTPVLDAQRSLAQVESTQAQHESRLAAGWIALLKALGVDAPGVSK